MRGATVTHRDLGREFAELEATGYHPMSNDPYYPDDIQQAEKRLRAEYRDDCNGDAMLIATQQ